MPPEPHVSTRTRPVALVPARAPATQGLASRVCQGRRRETGCHPGKQQAPCWDLRERERGWGGGTDRTQDRLLQASYFPAQFYSRVTVTLLGAPASFPPRHLGLYG